MIACHLRRLLHVASPAALGLVLAVAFLGHGCEGNGTPATPPEPKPRPEGVAPSAGTDRPVLYPRPDLPEDRVARGKVIVEGSKCDTCHCRQNENLAIIPVIDGIGYRVWQWKKGSIEDAKGWLVAFLTNPKAAEAPPWHVDVGKPYFKQPGFGLSHTPRQIEDMAYYLLSLWDIPPERTEPSPRSGGGGSR